MWPLLSGLCSVHRLKLGYCWTPCNAPVLQIRSIDFQCWSKISAERKCPSCSHPFLLPVILGRLSLSLVRKLIWCGSWRGHFHRAIWNTSCLLSSSARKAAERTVGSHLSFMFNFFFPFGASKISWCCKNSEKQTKLSSTGWLGLEGICCESLVLRSSPLSFCTRAKLSCGGEWHQSRLTPWFPALTRATGCNLAAPMQEEAWKFLKIFPSPGY